MNFGKTKLLHFSLNEGSQIMSGSSSTKTQHDLMKSFGFANDDDLLGKLSMVHSDESKASQKAKYDAEMKQQAEQKAQHDAEMKKHEQAQQKALYNAEI